MPDLLLLDMDLLVEVDAEHAIQHVQPDELNHFATTSIAISTGLPRTTLPTAEASRHTPRRWPPVAGHLLPGAARRNRPRRPP